MKAYWLSYPKTFAAVARSPLHWDENEWKTAGVVIFIGAALYYYDDEIDDMVGRNKFLITRDMAFVGNALGNGLYTVPAMGLTYLGGYVFNSPKTQDTALLGLKSLLISGEISYAIKLLTQRQRPLAGKGKGFWSGDKFSFAHDSFPSGHSAAVWCIAPILAAQYKESKWVPPVVYSLAVMTSYARMHDRRHWASDVAIGAAVGYFTGRLVLKTTPRLEVGPSPTLQGINLGYHF